MKTSKTKLLQRVAVICLSLAALLVSQGPPAYATSVACQKFAGDPDKVKQCEADTPTPCQKINRSTKAGEKQYDACLSANALSDNNPLIKKLNEIVNFLAAGVGVVVVAMVIVGGIQYSLAGDNQQKVSEAKKRITNALIALVIFIFMFSFLQWLIPGGIF